MFYIRHALVLIYFILLILLCVALAVPLFKTPVISIANVMGHDILGAKPDPSIPLIGGNWYDIYIAFPGVDATAEVTIHMFYTTFDVTVDASLYDFPLQHIHQKYLVEDVPCKGFAARIKTGQIFGLLSVFTALLCLVLLIANFFTRLLLPLLWFMTWLNIAFVSSTTCMLIALLCESSCDGKPEAMPPLVSIAAPEGGFGLYIICTFAYLFCSILVVFL